jgi:uncharacterized protein YutE (UPF0331/DUF86 family)
MLRRQIKRERPTLKTAHEFFRQGGFLTDPSRHFLSDDEHEAQVRGADDRLAKLVKRQFPRTQNLEYAILKSHLIIEHALVEYIRSFSAVAVEAKDIRFPFSQKLEFAYLLGFGDNDPTLLPTVEALNRVRNQVAHSFTLDRAAVDELLRINHEDYNSFQPKNDRQRIQVLRWICAFACGRISGQILGAFFATRRSAST